MVDKTSVRELLEEILDTGRSPEEVCSDCPELLPQVREFWHRHRSVQCRSACCFQSRNARRSAIHLPRSPLLRCLHRQPHCPAFPATRYKRSWATAAWEWSTRPGTGDCSRPVALKMLLAGEFARSEERERLLREAKAVASLRQVNIVQVYDVGDLNGRPYFTMEFVEGGNLAQKLAGTPQPARQAAARGRHDRRGHPCRSSKWTRSPRSQARQHLAHCQWHTQDYRLRTGQGAWLTKAGSLSVVSLWECPATWAEQARGRKNTMGPAVDVYALGSDPLRDVNGPAAVPGRVRVGNRAAGVGRTIPCLRRAVPSSAAILETIGLKCLRKEPERRDASAAALADDLRGFERGEPITARPVGRIERLARWARCRPTAAALAGVLPLAVPCSPWSAAGCGLTGSGPQRLTPRRRTCARQPGFSRSVGPRRSGSCP